MFTGQFKQNGKAALVNGLVFWSGVSVAVGIVSFIYAAGPQSALAHEVDHKSRATHVKRGFHKDFRGIDHWVKVFDDPERDKWQRPEKVVSELNVGPNQVVADIGAGTGYFAIRIASSQPAARVYAADVEKEMVDYLAKTAKERSVPNVIPFQISPNTPDLPEKIDLALVVDTYHHIDDRASYFRELRSRINPNGRVAIIDFTMESPAGPPKKHRISKDDVVKELAAAGFHLNKEVNGLPYQYFLIFTTMEKQTGSISDKN